MAYLGQMLAQYQANPAENWKAKDTAITLVIALSAKTQTASKGVSQVNANISLLDFFTTHVFGDLQSADIDSLPVLKADCVKFVSTFRNQLPKASATPSSAFLRRRFPPLTPRGDRRARRPQW